jgi:hypothetical protein
MGFVARKRFRAWGQLLKKFFLAPFQQLTPRPRKHPFFLLEVFLAMTLIAILAPWIMRLPITHYKAQISHFEIAEKQRVADWTFSEIKALLIQPILSWSQLPLLKEHSNPFPLPSVMLEIPGFKPKSLHRHFILKCKKEKRSSNGDIFRLYEVEIFLENDKKAFLYRINVHYKKE